MALKASIRALATAPFNQDAKIRAQADALRARRAELKARLEKAETRVIAAQKARRDILLAETIDDQKLASAERECSEATGSRDGLADANHDLSQQIEDIERQVADLETKAERVRLERETLARADRIEKAAAAVDAAATAFAAALLIFDSSVDTDGLRPAGSAIYFVGSLSDAMRNPVLRAAGLLEVSADARAAAKAYCQPFFVNAMEAAGDVHVQPLRDAAREIGAGSLPAARPVEVPPPLPDVQPQMCTAILRTPISWIDEAGSIATAPAGEASVPVPVQEYAHKAGIALSPGSAAGQAVLRKRAVDATAVSRREREITQAEERGAAPPEPIVFTDPAPHDTGVDLRVWRKSEHDRLMRVRAKAAA